MDLYLSYQKEAEKGYSTKKKQLQMWVILRILTFLATLVGVLLLSDLSWISASVAGFAGLILFLVFVVIHQKVKKQFLYFQKKRTLIEAEKQRLQYQFDNLPTGEAYLDSLHPYTRDLDIFGKGSLFSFLSRTHTLLGEKRLAQWLRFPSLDTQILTQRQQAIQELAQKTDLRLHFQTTAHLSEENAQEQTVLNTWLQNEPAFPTQKNSFLLLQVLRWALPLLTILAWIAAILGQISYSFSINFSILQLVLIGLFQKKLLTVYQGVGKNIAFLQKCATLWQIIEQQNFESPSLQKIQQNLKGSKLAATYLLKKLNLFEYRFNGFAFVILNGLFLWDIQLALALENWRTAYQQKVPLWLEALAETEALMSLASFAFNHPNYHYPTFSQEPILKTTDIAHPLIPENQRVSNHFTLNRLGEVALITGANMAGKSTFLRTLGINTVLANLGAPLPASHFEYRPLEIFTSMRIIDSLQDGTSSFFAELKRLKQILDTLQTKRPHLILLDEILRGTNSKDRYLGSEAVIKQLLKLPAASVIASHDVALGNLINDFPNQIKNYAFEVENVAEGLHYPYKISEGICQNTNAVFLMQKMGIQI
ncbi:MutS-related protein [Hugenholtzia roseola]|uniref:MutS-related protein n=1 Tax=Hugenholtzia roseola TaxID=1002 RepID=UPI0003F58311|nr:hypothetical protein [Hugenholtzia roseola]